jgi:hypothetical protein
MNNLEIIKRKELLSPFRKKTFSIRGEIRLLGFFQKPQYMRKQPIQKNLLLIAKGFNVI